MDHTALIDEIIAFYDDLDKFEPDGLGNCPDLKTYLADHKNSILNSALVSYIDIAISKGKIGIVKAILKTADWLRLNDSMTFALWSAAKSADENLVRLLIERGVSVKKFNIEMMRMINYSTITHDQLDCELCRKFVNLISKTTSAAQ